MSDTIICPNCQFEIEVTEVLSAQLRLQLQKEFEADIRKKESAIADREKEVARAQEAVAIASQDIDRRVAEQLGKERQQLSADALAKAREQVTVELQDKDQQLADAAAALKLAQDAELALRKERRELEEQKQALELTVNRRLDEERATIRENAKKEVVEERQLKDAEREKLISDLTRQVDEMKRKAEQGSQQLHGEVQELELESLLRTVFPQDNIEPVPKGEHGGDVIHRVVGLLGQPCGKILWESKRTKNWSDGWLSKLRDDQRAAKAEAAIIVSQALPQDVDTFNLIDGVWVTNRHCAIPVAIAIRHSLIELATARQAGEGQQTKMGLVYQYLTGQRFRHRIEAIVEKFTDMRADLDRERKTMTRLWAKREEQIRGVIESTAGMYGDLQGIAGKSLQEIDGLNVKLLEDNGGSLMSEPTTGSE